MSIHVFVHLYSGLLQYYGADHGDTNDSKGMVIIVVLIYLVLQCCCLVTGWQPAFEKKICCVNSYVRGLMRIKSNNLGSLAETKMREAFHMFLCIYHYAS